MCPLGMCVCVCVSSCVHLQGLVHAKLGIYYLADSQPIYPFLFIIFYYFYSLQILLL